MRKFFTLAFCFIFLLGGANAHTRDTIPVIQLHDVEVSALAKPSTTLSTNHLQVITQKDILAQGMQSLSDAVRQFNGIVLKDYGGIGGLKTVSIRGMGAEHTAISYDGIVVNNVQAGQVDIGRFSLDNVALVSLNIGQSDVIFQPARAFASAGVLTIQTQIPRFEKGQKNNGEIQLTAGSFGLWNPVLNYSNKLKYNHILSFNGSWQHANGDYPFTQKNDLLLTNRIRKNSDVSIYRSELNLYSMLGASGELRTKLYYFNSERGLPGNVIIANDYAGERLWDKNFFGQVSYSNKLGDRWKLKSQLKYDNTYTRYQIEALSTKRINSYTQQEVYTSNALLYTVNEQLAFSASEDLNYNSLKNEMANFGDNLPLPIRYGALTAIAGHYKKNRLSMTASLLGTYISEKVKNNNPNTNYKKLSPHVGVSYDPFSALNMRIRASYKQVFRIPTFTELYYVATGNKLNPESAKQYTLGLTWARYVSNSPISYVSISADAYYNKVADKIIIIPYPFMVSASNMGTVDIKGLDVNMTANVILNYKMNLNLHAAYSYMQALNVTNPANEKTYKQQIPYTPLHSGSFSVVFSNPWVNASYAIVVASKRYSGIQNIKENKVNGYADHTLSVNKLLKMKGIELLLRGSIVNILNKNYEVIAYYPMPGRSYSLSINYKF